MDFLKDFGVQPVLLAAQVVNFLILLFILKKFLYGPILKVLAQRRKTIEESLKNADEIAKRLQEISEKEAAVLEKAGKAGENLIKEATLQASQVLDEANKKREELLITATEDAKKAMVLEKDKILTEVRGATAEIVATVVEKVTGKLMNKKDQKEIIERSIKNLS